MTDIKRFLIATWGGGGNVPPALALGRRLRDAGHLVAVAAPGSLEGEVGASGLQFHPCASVAPWPVGLAFEDDLARFGAIRDSPEVAADLVAIIVGFRPNVVVADCMMAAAFAAAEHCAVPTAALVHVVCRPFVGMWGPLYVDPAPARVALALPPLAGGLGEMIGRADLVLALTPEEFDVPGPPSSPVTHYVGPVLEPGWDNGGASSPASVLITFGTTVQNQHRALPAVIEAVASLPVRGVLTLGGLAPAGPLPSADNIEVHDYLPHHAVLGETSVLVGHGGLSSTMAALAHGVPLVCLPQGRDQGINAERVQACGAGISLPPESAAGEIAETIAEVLRNPAYTESARSVARTIARLGAGRAAVEHLTDLAGIGPRAPTDGGALAGPAT